MKSARAACVRAEFSRVVVVVADDRVGGGGGVTKETPLFLFLLG